MQDQRLRKLVRMALLCAMSLVLMALVRIRLIPSLPFLEYDMADVPILIGAFFYGPGAGLLLTAMVSLLQAVTVSADSGLIGGLMHFLATGAYVLVAGLIYGRYRSLRGAFMALLAGSAAMVAVMVPLNYFISPMFLQSADMSYEAAQGLVWSVMWSFVAFNALKAGINSILTFITYKPVSRLFHRELGHKKPAGDSPAINNNKEDDHV